MAFFGHFFSRITAVYGVYFTNASIATLIMSLLPIWTYIFATCTCIEKIPDIRTAHGLGRIAGVFLGVLGSVLVTLGGGFTPTKQNISIWKKVIGYIALFTNGASTAIYFLVQKKYIYSRDTSRWQKKPFNVLIWNYVFGLVFLFLSNIYNITYHPGAFTEMKFKALYAFLYCIFVQSLFCFAAMAWTNMKVRSTFVSSFWPLYGIFGLFLAYWVLNETLNALEVSGASIVLISLPCVIWANFREDRIKDQQNDEITILEDQDGRTNHGMVYDDNTSTC